jgi:hypothetical protein
LGFVCIAYGRTCSALVHFWACAMV